MSNINKNFIRDVDILSTSDSTNLTTGALYVAGGVSIAKNVIIGQNLNVMQNMTVGNILMLGTLNTLSGPFSNSPWELNTSSIYYYNTTANSNVGINTTSPIYTLDINGSSRISSSLLAINNANTIGNIFTTGGNIGINNTSPQYALDVNGDINFSGIFRKDGASYISSQWLSPSSNILYYGTSSSISVGIGTTNPTFTLDVDGDSRISGKLITDSIFSTNATLTNLISSNIFSNSLINSSGITTSTLFVSNGITASNINFTGNIYQNGVIYSGSQWTSVSNGNISYTNGNVGINTTAPTYTLDVNGDSRVLGRLYTDSISTSNLITTNMTTSNLISTLGTISNLVTTNISSTNFIGSSISSTNIISDTGTFNNLTSINISSTNLLGSSAIINNMTNINTSSGSFSGTNLSIGNIYGNIGTITRMSSSFLDSNMASINNLVSTNSTFGVISVSLGNFTNISSSNISVSNIYSSNISVSNISVSNIYSSNISSSNIYSSDISSSNIYSSNISSSNIYSSNISSGTLFSDSFNNTTSSISNLISTAITTSNIISTGQIILDSSDTNKSLLLKSNYNSIEIAIAANIGAYSNNANLGDSIIRTSGGNLILQTNNSNANLIITSSGDVIITGTTNSVTISSGNLYSVNATISNIFHTNTSSATYSGTSLSTSNIFSNIGTVSNFVGSVISTGTLSGTTVSVGNINSLYSTISNLLSSNLNVTNTTLNNLIINSFANISGNSNTIANIFTTGGNIGIGTSSPTKFFQVNGESFFNGDVSIGNLFANNMTIANLITNNINLGISNQYSGSFAAANNIITPNNVTTFSFSNSNIRYFKADVSISLITTTGGIYQTFTMEGNQNSSGWNLYQSNIGENTGINFNITNLGQIQYTSTNITSWVSNTIRFNVSQITSNGSYSTLQNPTVGNYIVNSLQLNTTDDAIAGSFTGSLYTLGGITINKNIISGGIISNSGGNIVCAMNTSDSNSGHMNSFIEPIGCQLFSASAAGTITSIVNPVCTVTGADTVGLYKSPDAIYDFWRTYINLVAGTYTFRLDYGQNSDRGIVYVLLNGINVSTIDTYGSTSSPIVNSTTDIILSNSGTFKIELQVNDKNINSSGFVFIWRRAAFIRTA